jgi:hypothetical protein
MNALEWNPVFGPVVTGLIVLTTGAYFIFLLRRLQAKHGARDALILILPKMILGALIVLALLDPDLRLHEAGTTPAKVLVLEDISSSMDLRDDGRRGDRAEQIIRDLKSGAPASLRLEVLPFDTSVHEAGYAPKSAAERGTDLAGVIESLATQPRFSDADGAIVITDGGDETVPIPELPTLPIAFIGVGSSPENWNDIGIGNITAPDTVEEKSSFDVEADLYARPATPGPLNALSVSLEEEHDGKWNVEQSQPVDLSSFHGAVVFHVAVTAAGSLRYRVRLPQLPGELTYANNTRSFSVQVQPRALRVLYYTQELGVDYKYLRNELAADPGVLFTAMYRVLQDQFTVQGDRTGYQDLTAGLPTRDDVLRRYDCVILGSFPAASLDDAEIQALVRFTNEGGAVVFLGGDQSFGRGGYADSKLAPLIPWTLGNHEPDLAIGHFPVTVAPSAEAVDFTSGWREALGGAGGATLESLNQPGGLRPGAVALLLASSSGGNLPIVAWQRYGQGQVLGIATNTLWKWAAAGGGLRDFYSKFWRQTVRGLTQKLEEGELLAIHWNQPQYRPGEQAVAEVQLRGASDASAVRLVASLHGPSGDHDVDLVPVTSQPGHYQAKIDLGARGDYTFHITAYSGGSVAENYERILPVQPLVEEGANPELKESYLRQIAAQAHGIYTDEHHLEPVEAFLRGQVTAQAPAVSLPLTDYRNIFPLLALAILVIDWTVRRRYNLV